MSNKHHSTGFHCKEMLRPSSGNSGVCDSSLSSPLRWAWMCDLQQWWADALQLGPLAIKGVSFHHILLQGITVLCNLEKVDIFDVTLNFCNFKWALRGWSICVGSVSLSLVQCGATWTAAIVTWRAPLPQSQAAVQWRVQLWGQCYIHPVLDHSGFI